jgi:hypothetical protein
MKGTTHALAGGLAGAIIGPALPAFLGGIVMHAALDVVPHRDEEDPPLLHLAVDALAVLTVLTVAVLTGNVGMAAGAIGGVIPDIENVPDILFKRKYRKVFPSHWFDHQRYAGSWWARYGEVAVIVAVAIGLAVVIRPTGLGGVLK